MKQRTIHFLLVVSIVLISLSAIFVKLSRAPSTIIVMYRMIMGCILLMPFVIKQRDTFKRMSGREWLSILFAGVFLAGHFALWFESLNHTSVASSTLILALQPAVALIGGYFFFKEAIQTRTLLTLGIALMGVAIVGGGSASLGKDVLFGNILSLLSVFSVVFYLLIGQRNMKSMNHWVYSFLVFFVAGATMAIFNAVGKIPFIGYSSDDWIVFILLAVFPTGAHIIYNLLLKYVNTTTISMTILGEPVGASMLAFIFLNEKIALIEAIGGALIIAGIYLFLKSQSDASEGAKQITEPID